MADLPGYARAQQEWENREPERPGPCECAECNGYGVLYSTNPVGEDEERPCTECAGQGWISESGEPCKSPDAQQADADEAADLQRDYLATKDTE
ncbi:MAG: hypothetical protein WC023_06310 [Rhodocyclaceae bacterium]